MGHQRGLHSLQGRRLAVWGPRNRAPNPTVRKYSPAMGTAQPSRSKLHQSRKGHAGDTRVGCPTTPRHSVRATREASPAGRSPPKQPPTGPTIGGFGHDHFHPARRSPRLHGAGARNRRPVVAGLARGGRSAVAPPPRVVLGLVYSDQRGVSAISGDFDGLRRLQRHTNRGILFAGRNLDGANVAAEYEED